MHLESHLKLGIQQAVWKTEHFAFGISEAKFKAVYVRELQFDISHLLLDVDEIFYREPQGYPHFP
jgi:hypothetical protein